MNDDGQNSKRVIEDVAFCFHALIIGWVWVQAGTNVMVCLRSGVNFINILRADFTCKDPKRAKNTVKLSVFLRIKDLRA